MGMTIEELVAENDKLKRQLAYESTALTMMKADYKARLKADMVAMLTEIQLEIEEVPKYCMTHDATCVYRKTEEYISDVNNLIQQKINALKAEGDTKGEE